MTPPSYIDLESLDASIERWLQEDVGAGDVTTLATIPADRSARAVFLAKERGIIAGCDVVQRIFERAAQTDEQPTTIFESGDGAIVEAGTVFGEAVASARTLLVGERLALNVMQRMSGISTVTRRMVDAVAGTNARVLDTRKTAPGLRMLDKWAVRIGGGSNHRIGLFDMILIKDNHIAACGGIGAAIERAVSHRQQAAIPVEIEVETRTLAEVEEALEHPGVDRILLDNMAVLTDGRLDTTMLESAVTLVGRRIPTEASGNVTLETARAIAKTGVDFISCGALTHSVRALDISMKIHLGD